MNGGNGMGVSYRDAGVDIAAGEEVVRRIGGLVRSTARPGVIGGIGGFSGLFALDQGAYREPVLVASTDGVGTKLKVAFLADRHDTIGIDAVAMCVNDVAVCGAEPLFFLDYLAVGRLQPAQVEEIVAGVAAGCRLAGCALLGGETAEMPGFYPPGEYDVAGFCVGIVERDAILDGSDVKAGDVLVGLQASGLHSNGFSLVRRVLLEDAGLDVRSVPQGLDRPLGEELLEPTRIYVPVLRALVRQGLIKAAAHITGGGLVGNVPRALPDGLAAHIVTGSWPEPAICRLVAEYGQVARAEMFATFNMGIGLVVVVAQAQVDDVLTVCTELGEQAYVIGAVKSGPEGQPAQCYLEGE
jgi:phosphoribosylformylglycinamidine cyclo-ligase